MLDHDGKFCFFLECAILSSSEEKLGVGGNFHLKSNFKVSATEG